MVDLLQEQIEQFFYKWNESPTTPNARFTPSNSRHVESISKRAQAFNKDLEQLQKRFSTMRDIDYEKAKIDLVYAIAERCVKHDQNVFIQMLIDRLKLLD